MIPTAKTDELRRALLRVLRGKRRTEFESARPYAQASADGPTYHGWEHAFETRFFADYLQREGFDILETRQGFFLANSILLLAYLFALSLIPRFLTVAGNWALRNVLALRARRSSREAMGKQTQHLVRRWMIMIFGHPRNLFTKFHRLYLKLDLLEHQVLPNRDGGVFMISALKRPLTQRGN